MKKCPQTKIRHFIPTKTRAKFYCQKSRNDTFFTLLTTNFMQILEKTNEQSPIYLKIEGWTEDWSTDRGNTDKQGQFLRTLLDKHGVQKYKLDWNSI